MLFSPTCPKGAMGARRQQRAHLLPLSAWSCEMAAWAAGPSASRLPGGAKPTSLHARTTVTLQT
jgi:hypothetical protein